MDTKNVFGQRPTMLRAAEPLGGPVAGPVVALGYGPGSPLAKDQVLRGRSPRPEQGERAGSRSIG